MLDAVARAAPSLDTVERAVERAAAALAAAQQADGHWVFELEADATIPAEYVLLRHYLGEPVDAALEAKIARYLRRIQSAAHDGWSLFHGGGFDVSASVKAYFALKVIGDDVDAPHMARARAAIHAAGAAESLGEGLAAAEESVDTGAAGAVLATYAKRSQEMAA